MEKIGLGVAAIIVVLIAVVMLTDDHALKSDAIDYTARKTTVGVMMSGPVTDDGWTAAHYRAFETLKDELNLSLRYAESVPPEAADETIQRFVKDGAKLIFATSFQFGDAMVKAAAEFPDVKFFHCTGLEQRSNLATYMGRIYQMRYLCGVAAGLQTRTNHLGYVAAMKIDEVMRGINAFTLGARSVNPKATVHVVWTGAWFDPELERQATERLLDERDIDIMAYHQDSEAVIQVAKERGIKAVGYNVDKSIRFPETVLTSAVWSWAPFYRRQIRSVLEDEFRTDAYWAGVETGIVGLAPLASFARHGVKEAVDREMERLRSGGWDVFHGPIRDIASIERVNRGAVMTDAQLLGDFKWFVRGVVEERPVE